MSDVSPIMKWLDELARYFENRDTGGEDRAHWANVYNSENALKVKAALTASEAEVERLRTALKPFAEMADNIVAQIPDDDRVPIDFVQEWGDEKDSVSVEAFRRARAALTGEKP